MLTQRMWGARDALVAAILLVAAGTGAALRGPGLSGWPLVLPFVVATTIFGVLAAYEALMSDRRRLTERGATAALIVVFLLFVAWYVLREPVYGPGSDNAEALEIGVRQLAHFQNPWGAETRFGNPLSPMLGGYLLAAPFMALTGNMYAQGVAWMALLLVVLHRKVGAHAALAVGGLFLLSPHTRLAVPNQSDNWVVAVAVLLTAWWGQSSLQGQRALAQWASAIMFGVALSYRFTLWVSVVPVAVFFVKEFGLRRALGWLSVAGVVTVLLSFGPLLIDAQTYLSGPFAAGVGKASSSDVPGATILVAAITLLVLAWTSARVRCWADVWMSVSLSLAAMIGALVLTRLPLGLDAALVSYETIAYNGAWLILGLVSLVLPRDGRAATGLGGVVVGVGRAASPASWLRDGRPKVTGPPSPYAAT